MTNLQRGAWTGICCLLALGLGSAPARSQTSFAAYNGIYTIVDRNTGSESLLQLEFIPGERDGFMVATVFGTNGKYRVFAGPIFTQGSIPISITYLSAARSAYQVLKRPRFALAHPETFLNQQDQCQFRLLASEEQPSTFDYSCYEQGRLGSSGRGTRLRN